MPANPEPGLSYRQEYYKGEAEDKAAVITVGEEQVQVPFGYFNKDVLMTRDLVPTEPKVQELKFYAPNVGPAAERAHRRRRRPCGAGQLHQGQLAGDRWPHRAGSSRRRGPAPSLQRALFHCHAENHRRGIALER